MFIKICGVTNATDALLSAGLGADAVGLNFCPSSVRKITVAKAKDIVRRMPPEVLTVGIFQNERRERVVQIARDVGLRAVQLHGDESEEDTRWVADQVPNVIRVFAAADPERERIAQYGPVQLMIDSPQPGSGKPFDWNVLLADRPSAQFLLAGGLNPDNLAEAIALLNPWGVDVATGVERSPGEKDPVKLRRFIATARSFGQSDRMQKHPNQAPTGWPFHPQETIE